MVLRIAVLFGCLLYCGLQAAPQPSVPSKDWQDAEAQEILSKAAELVDIKAEGSPTFILVAKAHLQEDKKWVDGMYQISWAAPGRFRRSFRFPNFSETAVAVSDKLYRQRTTEGLPLLVWELNRLMEFLPRHEFASKAKVKRVQGDGTASADMTCMSLERHGVRSRVCLDSATNDPLTVDVGAGDSESFREHYDFSDYQTFETKRFPRKLSFHGWGSRVIEVQIEKLARVQDFAPNEFTPPKGSQVSYFCENPEMTGEVKPSTQGSVPVGFHDLEIDMYFEITPIGAVRYAQVVYSSQPLNNKEVLNWFIGTHFPIQTCAGRPVGYETIIRFAPGH